MATHAQETIDTAWFWAQYKFSYKTALEQPEFDDVDWIYLDMGNKVTKFYSRYGEIRDSIMNNGFKNGLSAWEVLELIKLVDGLLGRDPAHELTCSCTERIAHHSSFCRCIATSYRRLTVARCRALGASRGGHQ